MKRLLQLPIGKKERRRTSMSEEKKVNEIKATKKLGDVDKEATVLYDFGGDLDTAVENFGAEVVYSGFVRSAVITAQSVMRRFLEDGLAQEEIEAKMEAWKPGVSLERVVDPTKAFLNKFDKMTDEEREAVLEQLRAKAGV